MWHTGSRPRLIAAAVASSTALAGLVVGALPAIDGAAVVTEPATRGQATQVDEPERPTTTPYRLPVTDTERMAWSDTHASYPATDLFVGCGAVIVSPVWGTVLEVRRVDSYDPTSDDPATRGGRSVSIQGFDGVRYYLAHFDTIVDTLEVGDQVGSGQTLGRMGDSGRASACHLHFGISPPCRGPEWAVRRGVVWPHPYLDAWRNGMQFSPAAEVDAWLSANPTACADAVAGSAVGAV